MFKESKLEFFRDKIIDTTTKIEVMMDWEKEIMFEHAKAICKNGGDILEIGFGMGIAANYIHSFNISSYTIMEIHPQILTKLYKWSEDKKNVTIIEGDWYQNLDKLKKYDGIFFDTFLDENARNIKILINYLKENGIFSWYNPMINKNTLKLKCDYKNIAITPPPNQYNNTNLYSVPIFLNK